jgi:uncharacterized lipoprotein YddW (UPF0748 family)
MRAALVLTLTTAMFALCANSRAAEIRALWVTRGEYDSAAEVKKVVANAAAMNFNVVLFQVRGNGTVFYKSKIEPWAYELTSKDPKTTGQDPGWDPLRVAIDEAKAQGIELHAWINVFPAWRSQQYPPRSSKQLWGEHPEWFMRDAAGDRMIPRDHRFGKKLPDWYSFLSPGVPQVQDYIASVCGELADNYEIDGLHMDYIRYPREITEVKPAGAQRAKLLGNWSYDAVSLRRFTAETKVKRPEDDPEKWFAWRADQVTATVQKIRERVRAARPKAVLSAAVGVDADDARRNKGQSYIEWLDKGWVEAVFLMGYTPDPMAFEKQCAKAWSQYPKKGYMCAGVGTKYAPKVVRQEIEIAQKLGMHGFAGFSYLPLVDVSKDHKLRVTVDEMKAGPMREKVSTPWRNAAAPTAARPTIE